MKILFYDDVAVYGGHEVMFLGSLNSLLRTQSLEIGVVFSQQNERLKTELEQLRMKYPSLALNSSDYTSGRFQFLRTAWAYLARRRLGTFFRGQAPDCVVVVQGEISLSSVGVIAARNAGCYTVSYLPLAHTRKQRGERVAWLKDKILRKYYQLPNHFITIGNSVQAMIRRQGAKQPIDIVENGINLDSLNVFDKEEAREKLGIPQAEYIAALVGRIEFRQKGHDILLKALASRSSDFDGWKILIIGSGPDQLRLEAMITELKLADKVILLPWQANLSEVYSAIDMVLMPSWFEGVPVVMLEALYYGLPVVGTNIDAMKELLPAENLFPVGDFDTLSERMLHVRSQFSDLQRQKDRQLIINRFTKSRQEQEFKQVLLRCAHLGRDEKHKNV